MKIFFSVWCENFKVLRGNCYFFCFIAKIMALILHYFNKPDYFLIFFLIFLPAFQNVHVKLNQSYPLNISNLFYNTFSITWAVVKLNSSTVQAQQHLEPSVPVWILLQLPILMNFLIRFHVLCCEGLRVSRRQIY